ETVAENGQASNVFDGSATTRWVTQWQSAAPPPPHEIRINMGAVYNVTGFRYLPRQDGATYGDIGQYEFYVSNDVNNWGAPVAVGTFATIATEQQVLFPGHSGQYVKLRQVTEVLGRPWAAVAEMN